MDNKNKYYSLESFSDRNFKMFSSLVGLFVPNDRSQIKNLIEKILKSEQSDKKPE